MTTLLLVEDEALIRHGLRAWLDQVLDVTVVGEASNGAEAILLAQALRPDVILVDLSPTDGWDQHHEGTPSSCASECRRPPQPRGWHGHASAGAGSGSRGVCREAGRGEGASGGDTTS